MALTRTPAPVQYGTALPAPTASIYASGTSPASGIDGSGAYCSAMHIREQQMFYTYKRVPMGSINWAPSDVSLTGINIGGTINKTALIVQAQAAVASYIVSGECWTTSAFTVPQRFTVQSISGVEGHQYGQVSAGCFGPGGDVFNQASAMFYSRKPTWWVSSMSGSGWEDTLTFAPEIREIYNFAIVDGSADANCGSPTYPQAQPGSQWTGYNFLCLGTNIGPNTDSLCGLKLVEWINPLADKLGGYRTNQDNTTDVQIVTDTIGAAIRDGGWVNNNNFTSPSSHYNPDYHTWS
tara:strand:+ start:1786 stop:2667 length:882 start_codon:yes stop_codon:yes gene_type:complete